MVGYGQHCSEANRLTLSLEGLCEIASELASRPRHEKVRATKTLQAIEEIFKLDFGAYLQGSSSLSEAGKA